MRPRLGEWGLNRKSRRRGGSGSEEDVEPESLQARKLPTGLKRGKGGIGPAIYERSQREKFMSGPGKRPSPARGCPGRSFLSSWREEENEKSMNVNQGGGRKVLPGGTRSLTCDAAGRRPCGSDTASEIFEKTFRGAEASGHTLGSLSEKKVGLRAYAE